MTLPLGGGGVGGAGWGVSCRLGAVAGTGAGAGLMRLARLCAAVPLTKVTVTAGSNDLRCIASSWSSPDWGWMLVYSTMDHLKNRAACLLVAAAGWTTAASAAGWQRLIDPGVGTEDKAERLVVTADGGLAVLCERAGTTFRLIRLDLNGKVQPGTGLPGTVDDMHPATFVATSNGGFAGGSFGPRFVAYDKKLARTVKRFDPFQVKTTATSSSRFLAPQADGSLLALAQSQKALVRLTIDKAGALGPQQKALGSFNRLSSLGGTAALKDGSIVVTGDTDADKDEDRHVRVVKIDPQGKIGFDVSFGGKKKDYGATMVATADGGLLVAGGTTSSGAGALDWYLAKLDGSGKKLWDKTLGTDGNDFIARVVELPKGGFVAGGNFKEKPTLVRLIEAAPWCGKRAFLAPSSPT